MNSHPPIVKLGLYVSGWKTLMSEAIVSSMILLFDIGKAHVSAVHLIFIVLHVVIKYFFKLFTVLHTRLVDASVAFLPQKEISTFFARKS